MILHSFATETVALVRPVWTSTARGGRQADFANGTRRTVVGVDVQPGASPELLGGRDQVTVRYTVKLTDEQAQDVDATDAVEYRGKRYAIDGEPQRWPSPAGGLAHVVLLLIDWKG